MPIKITLNIEKYYLQNDFIIQSCNTLDHKTQNFEDDGFIISSNFMIMNELEYRNMLRQLTKEQRLIFDDIVYRKNIYHNIPIHIFFIGGARIGKSFTLKLVIQDYIIKTYHQT
jgi:hypothetical protein